MINKDSLESSLVHTSASFACCCKTVQESAMLLSPGNCALMSEAVPLAIKATTTSSSAELEAALVDSVCLRLTGVLATVANDTVSFCFGLTGKSAM
jgi:hypothetical protein